MAEHRRTNSIDLPILLLPGESLYQREPFEIKPYRQGIADIKQPVDCEHGAFCNVTAGPTDEAGRHAIYCESCWTSGVRTFKAYRYE